ncbi:hypothetical protein F3J20_14200 [Paraburkholderia sp. Cy-641]|uniref:hypothetical protein n=1 Tax=Paraburkholderia sp. Cy-641 TaxID=2608337 RepID=UPI001421E362|nr:hypothetical protein [Paraburkholderia sp. Cy-641]NIF78523.1 hypothetical protein [Paraburkholderia sp. Cy-641]
MIRVYDRNGSRLLAERTYVDLSDDPVRLYWEQDSLQYPENDNLGTIKLPPSLYDRFMAKLP